MDYPGHFKDEVPMDAQRAVRDLSLLLREGIRLDRHLEVLMCRRQADPQK